MSTRTKQVLMVIASLASATTIAYLTKSGWVYAPTVIALLTELRTAFGLSAIPLSVAEVKGRLTGAVPPVVPILLLAAALGVTSCKTVTVPDAGTVVTIAETCAVKAVHDVALSIIGDVNSALAATEASWEGELAALALKFGSDAVKCAIAEVTNSSIAKASASHDPLESLKAERGKAWLAAH